ncbi:MAG: hypothetical protein L0226_11150 [Acidobacteria bacterium]|nr:hypothetical protein [Acidobacteriota bacterium]
MQRPIIGITLTGDLSKLLSNYLYIFLFEVEGDGDADSAKIEANSAQDEESN